jgi:rfaE bifunctional protein kinase chain/domain
MEDFRQLFNSFSSLKIGVIGDVMLDTYMVGHVDRISPEAPVPVISLHHKEFRIGGAGNVALNCRSLGAQASILSVTGDDANGLLFRELLDSHDIDTSYLLKSSKRITTSKTRIISRNQQMMRVDEEITTDLIDVEEKALLEKVQQYISANDPDVIIFEDYNKGILTPGVINEVMTLCKNAGIITAVDPKRKNFFSYKGADIFKPNLKEVREALNLLSDSTDITALQKMHTALHQQLNNKISFITLSDKGIFYQDVNKGEIIASHLRHIADVSGAGDTVMAVAAMVYAVSKNTKQMAEIANIAGGLVCEEVGTVAVNKEKLLKECASLLR